MKIRSSVASFQALTLMASLALGMNPVAHADTPASLVTTTTVSPGQSYPEVPVNGEGWFDVGGYCKVVDVGTLSAFSATATGIPVFIPGPAAQWENYRTLAGTHYDGQLTLTTCCRPATNIAALCTEAGATVLEVSRQYGRVGEVDAVAATCVDQWGRQYQDQVNVACEVSGGGADGPDAQGVWAETGADATSGCSANAYTSACTVSCGGGTQQTFDSCGNVTATTACNTQACCTPAYSETSASSCSGSCGGGSGTQTVTMTDERCGTGSYSETVGCTNSAECACGAGVVVERCTPSTTVCGSGSVTDCGVYSCNQATGQLTIIRQTWAPTDPGCVCTTGTYLGGYITAGPTEYICNG